MDRHQTISQMLSYVDGHNRERWVKMGAAIKTELGEDGFELWNEWSQTSDNYNASAAKATWRSLKPGFITLASLVYEAKEGGYRPDKPYQPPSAEELAERKKKQDLAQQHAIAQRQQEIAHAARLAKQRWAQAQPAELTHPYLTNKGISHPKLLKFLRQEHGRIMIPIKLFGKIKGVQTINDTGMKSFQKEMGLDGASFILGPWKAGLARGVIITEGFATGASLYLSTGITTLVAFTGHNMGLVAKNLINAFMPVVIAADYESHGAGKAYAEQAAEPLGKRAIIIEPEFSESERKNHFSDFNDLAMLRGSSALKEPVERAFCQINEHLNEREVI